MDLPPTWEALSPERQQALRRQFLVELDDAHALGRAAFDLVAAHKAEDYVLADAPGLSPRYYVMHLSWSGHEKQEPYPLDALADLDGMLEPAPETVDEISLWTKADTETGLVFVQHLLNGRELIEVLDESEGAPETESADALRAMGWKPVTAPLSPSRLIDGALVPTGQTVEFWTRPVTDDFALFRIIRTPGEKISLMKLIPAGDFIIEYESDAELRDDLPDSYACPFVSPMAPRYGRAGFPRKG